MNELRMYVERLFEGRVLTAENIELKEEIYGNLVARYEDLLAQGVSKDEALRRTEESITSVDDVLDGADEGAGFERAGCDAGTDTERAVDADVCAGDGPHPATGDSAEPQGEVSDAVSADMGTSPAAKTVVLEGGPTPLAETAAAPMVGPTPPEGMAHASYEGDAGVQAARPKRGKVWPWACGGCLVLALVSIVFVGVLFGVAGLGAYDDGAPSTTNTSDGATPGTGAPSATDLLHQDDEGISVDESGNVCFDGERADTLIWEVVEHSFSDVLSTVDVPLNDTVSLGVLLTNLPMGQWETSLDVTRGAGELALAYIGVPDHYDGDSVDAALAYNATVLFCAVPDLQTLTVTVSESDDLADEDTYVFLRTDLEEAYGIALGRDMVNEAGWRQLKGDNLYKDGFAERLVDRAEERAR